MRLQLVPAAVAALLALLLGPGVGQAQPAGQAQNAEARLRIYTDDDHVTVVSPSALSRFAVGDALDVEVGTSVDAVSAASVDVITSASPSSVRELRVEGSGAATWALKPTLRLRAGGVVSHESDYDAYRPGIGGQIEIADRNATIDISYTGAIDSVGSAVDPMFERARRGHIGAVSITQILDPKTYLDVLVDLRHMRGYHASPYRLVQVRSVATPSTELVEERTPTLRQSGAALLRIRRAFGSRGTWFANASYRLYGDTWDVMSHTLNAQVLHSFDDERYLFGLHLRAYLQGGADFYQAYYEGDGDLPEYRTRDRTLGGMRTLHGSVTCDAALSGATGAEAWRLRGMLAATQFVFSNFPAQRERRALILGVTVVAPL